MSKELIKIMINENNFLNKELAKLKYSMKREKEKFYQDLLTDVAYKRNNLYEMIIFNNMEDSVLSSKIVKKYNITPSEFLDLKEIIKSNFLNYMKSLRTEYKTFEVVYCSNNQGEDAYYLGDRINFIFKGNYTEEQQEDIIKFIQKHFSQLKNIDLARCFVNNRPLLSIIRNLEINGKIENSISHYVMQNY